MALTDTAIGFMGKNRSRAQNNDEELQHFCIYIDESKTTTRTRFTQNVDCVLISFFPYIAFNLCVSIQKDKHVLQISIRLIRYHKYTIHIYGANKYK